MEVARERGIAPTLIRNWVQRAIAEEVPAEPERLQSRSARDRALDDFLAQRLENPPTHVRGVRRVEVDLFAGHVARALDAFATDPSYAVQIARAAWALTQRQAQQKTRKRVT
ncbi:hypothetical protein GCM10010532_011230 [Dactylosporangium siamense]|uniref:Uncharacterized protein n=2 Tax=Dactylosporangium siamense TaxID=685454 RepID=A0A919PJA1_9ACTN|nr:hypothetical protein Dsi01nite_010340 [Dactylosporangium siamense]